MKYFFYLLCFLIAPICNAQVPSAWHKVQLPPAPLLRIAQTCDGYIGQSSSGFFRTEDEGENWIAIDLSDMPKEFGEYYWLDNDKGVVIGFTNHTGGSINCTYSATDYWNYDCLVHKFVHRLSSSDFDCWHSGGTSTTMNTIDHDKFYYRKMQWDFGIGSYCQQASVSLNGGEYWAIANCDYETLSNSDSTFYISHDSIYLNPPGLTAKMFHARLPFNSNYWNQQVLQTAGNLIALHWQNGKFAVYHSSDFGVNWLADSLQVYGSSSNLSRIFEKDGRLFIQSEKDLYVALLSFPLVFKPICPGHTVPYSMNLPGLGNSSLIPCVSSPVWFVTTSSGETLRSLDYGESWQTSMAGLGSALSADYYFNGDAPLLTVSGKSYIMQGDESMLPANLPLSTPVYPRWSWKRDNQEWVFVDKYVLRKNEGLSFWDTLSTFSYYPLEFYSGGQDGDTFFAVSNDLSSEKFILYSNDAGQNWALKNISDARYFAIAADFWYRVGYDEKLYRSNDFGENWEMAQQVDWLTTSLMQRYHGALYVIARTAAGTNIYRKSTLDDNWELLSPTQLPGTLDAYVAESGYFLWQNLASFSLLTHCDSSETKPLIPPCTYPLQINSDPIVFVDLHAAKRYQIWQDRLLAYSHQAELWSAKLSDLLPPTIVSAVREPDKKPVRIYPNPAQDQVSVEFSAPFSGKLELLNAQATILHTVYLNDASISSIRLSDLPSGFYALRFLSADKEEGSTKWVLLNHD